MTLRPLPRSRLDGLIPSIVSGQHFIALVPVTGDARWAASAAWAVARAAAAGGRRVALVDLSVEQPELHASVGLPMGTGIVDAFQSGAELTAAAQEVDGVFFIPAGASTAAPEFVLAHPRWKKLHAGFRAEDALLIVYLPGGSLARLAELPDAIIALGPEGVSLESPAAAGLVALQSQGTTLLGIVRERWTPIGTAAPPPGSIPPPAHRPERRRGGLIAAVVVVVLVIGGAAWVWFSGIPAALPTRAPTQPDRAVSMPGSAAPRAPDTLAWTVQLAAYGTLDNALTHADELAREHITAFVTPVEATRAVWYRVLVGAYVSRDSAIAARQRLWDKKLARKGEGELLRAPYSLALPDTADVAELRRLGFPAMRWRPGDRPLLGAFENAEQAVLARTMLERAGIPATLIARLEVAP